MSAIKASEVKSLREQTGAGMMDCKKALVESGGDMAAAIEYLQARAAAKAVKRMDRDASEGRIDTYIHGQGRIAVMLELNSETDFVARNDAFGALVKELCLHVAASAPLHVSRESVGEEEIGKAREVFRAQALEEGKPEKIVDKIIEGRIDKWLKESCMLEQPWFRDADMSVADVLQKAIGTLGENIKVRRFVRWELGEGV